MEEEKIYFLRMKLHNERDVILSYYNISKEQIRYMLSEVLNKPVEKCKIKYLNYDEICKSFDFFRTLIKGARNDGGKRVPKTIKNYKQYGKQLRNKE